MGMKTRQKHEQKPLASNQQATLQVPVGGKIHNLMLVFLTSGGVAVTEAQIRAEIGNIRLTIGGTDIINSTAVRLLDIYEALGVNVSVPAGVPGVLELNIGRQMFTDPAVRDLFGIGTAGITSVQIQVHAGTLSAIASVQAYTSREGSNEGLGTYCRVLDYAQSYNAIGQHTADTLPRDQNTAYALVMMSGGASGTLNSSEVRANSLTVREDTLSAVNSLDLSDNRYAQPAGYYVHAFTDGSMARLPMKNVTDFRLLNTFTVAPGAAGYVITPVTIVNLPDNIPA